MTIFRKELAGVFYVDKSFRKLSYCVESYSLINIANAYNVANSYNTRCFMIRCDKCGEGNRDNAKFCMYCGFELPKREVAESPASETLSVQPKKKFFNAPVFIGIIVGLAVMVSIQQFVFKPSNTTLDKAMMQYAGEINKSCPVMIDSETRLDNVMAIPVNVFQYTYTLVNMEKSTVDTLQLKNSIEPNIVNFVKTNPQMKYVRDKNVTVNYYYKDKQGIYLFMVSVKPEQYQ